MLLQNQLESCRYSLVPIGNMVTDQPLFISDVFYTRHLTQHNHIIWCSPTNQPDLGGKYIAIQEFQKPASFGNNICMSMQEPLKWRI